MGFGGTFASGDNGSRIKSIPANRSTGRGFAANRVYLDEFAYAEYADDIYQSVSPAVSQGGYLTIGSTPNGVGNLFHQLYTARRALRA
jgi:phage FluMu gp28-like protein